jgi:hypothetical protein
MRDRDTIDAELRRLAALRRSIREQGGELSSRQVDELLDERLGHLPEVSATDALGTWEKELAADAWARRDKRRGRRKGVLRRFGLLTAVPVSLVAIATVLVVMFALHKPHPTAEPTEVPPSSARPNPPPPTSARPNPAAPKTQTPPTDIVDRAFIDALKHEGVPVPSHEYVTIHGHAVCDFLAHSNFTEAVGFVQRSSIWDANQSAEFTAGAVVSYCPQYLPAGPDETQLPSQNALSDLQAIEGDLQGIRDRLKTIPGQP